MSPAERVLNMSTGDFLVWLGVLGFLTLFGLWGGFRRLRHARLIENVPTARIRSAHQGYVELVGSAEVLPGEPIIAPLSGSACCWYDFRIERRSGKHWNVVDKGTSEAVFIIRDDTGECLIDPDEGGVTTTHRQSWYGNSEWPEGGNGVRWGAEPRQSWHASLNRLTGLRVTVDIGMGRYRYREEVIMPGDDLYVVGEFRTLDQAYHAQGRDDIATDYLRRWKRYPQDMARFDSNGDGTVDAGEWEVAREQARAQADKEVRELQQAGPVHTIGRPADGRPFLIANLPQFDLVRRFRLQGWSGLGLFLVAGATMVFMVSTRWVG
jgi:hypothetical protein